MNGEILKTYRRRLPAHFDFDNQMPTNATEWYIAKTMYEEGFAAGRSFGAGKADEPEKVGAARETLRGARGKK